MRFKVATFILLFLISCSVLEAARDRWVVLGRKTVNFRVERDQIVVTGWRGEFKRLQFYVRETGVHILDAQVIFANGRRVDLPVRSFIPPNGRSRIFDLPGRARVIQKIVLVYKTAPVGDPGKSLVEVWGLRD
jgi:hypothetical protein